MSNTIEHTKVESKVMWNRNFIFLWFGQLISTVGDVVYAIALGFWVLSVTGSTALMGALMASSTLPGLLVSPFAGVLVDRRDRRFIMILMNVISGVSVIFIGIAACTGLLQVWMVFIVGILLSCSGAFFQPSANSVIPDLVPKAKIVNATSAFGMISVGSNIIGNSAGGLLYQLIGVPLMFLFNGISFVFSGISLIFIKIPQVHKKEQQHFFKDFKDGVLFVWKFKGLRYMFLMGAIINFFFNIATVLLLPFFQKTAYLGPAKYGIFMASFMIGMFLGMVFTSLFRIAPSNRMRLFIISLVLTDITLALIPALDKFGLMLVLVILGGFANSFVNVFMRSSMQLAIPQDKRGKVFGLVGTINQGLTPIAMAIGGVLGEFLPINIIISACCILSLLISIPFLCLPTLKHFINYDLSENLT